MDKFTENVKISIIVPMYNAGEFIDECIKSVFNQTLKDIELIIIDDGSTDNSCQVVEKYAECDDRISLLKQDHKGSGPARNLGMENAKGEYIAFLDADDFYYDPKALEYMYSHGKKEHASICASYRMKLLSTGCEVDNYLNLKSYPDKDKWMDFSEVQNNWCYQSYIFSKRTIEENKIKFPPYLRGQDPPFLLAMMKVVRKFLLCPVKMYCYRWGHQKRNFSERQIIDALKGMRDVLEISLECQWYKLVKTIVERLDPGGVYYRFIKRCPSLEVAKLLERINTLLIYSPCGLRLKILEESDFVKHSEVKISVIVPVYNVEKYLVQCLNSICGQDFKGFEVICVDDGSLDDSLSILLEYERRYENVHVLHKDNGGLSSARNYGLKRAQGNYVVYIDSDDILCTQKALSLIWSEVSKNDLDLLFFDTEVVISMDMDKSAIRDKIAYFERKKEYGVRENGYELFADLVINNDYIGTAWGNCVRRVFLLEQNLEFPIGRLNEDEPHTFKMILNAGKTKHIQKKLYGYRQRCDSIMNKNVSLDRVVDNICTLLEMKELHESREWPDYADKAICSYMNRQRWRIGNLYKNVSADERAGSGLCTWKRYILENFMEETTDGKQEFVNCSAEMYSFPYHLFPRGTRVVIYGAGDVGKQFYEETRDSAYIKCVALIGDDTVDRGLGDIKTLRPEDIVRLEYDAVLLAVNELRDAEKIRKKIIGMGVLEEKIYWDGALYSKRDFQNRFYFKLLDKI